MRLSTALRLSPFALLLACPATEPPAGTDAGADAGTALDAPPAVDTGPTGPLPDLTIDEGRAESSARVIWEYFEADDCAIAEGCVDAPGWRRIMRFETFTPNHGTADLHMGDPTTAPDLFTYSSCHMHYHFNGYANYELLDGSGATVANGHKQAFCLEDSEPTSASSPTGPNYDCGDQGITMGWGDSYGPYLDCQWIDVTDVTPGDYTLRITINGEHALPELSYDDNVANASVTVPPDGDPDPTVACPSPLDGPRDCGWTVQGTLTCTAGANVEIGCGGSCGVGTCGGDTILRVCPDATPCSSREALAYGDSECGGADCPGATVVCPTSGEITILTASYAGGGAEAITCAIVP